MRTLSARHSIVFTGTEENYLRLKQLLAFIATDA